MSSLISVVVPTYRVEPYIEQCIESILNQTHSDIELLLLEHDSPGNGQKRMAEHASCMCRIKEFLLLAILVFKMQMAHTSALLMVMIGSSLRCVRKA